VVSCAKSGSRFIELGSSSAKERWVYLCGLTENFDSVEEQRHRQILDDIGHRLNISFIALVPRNRCPQFDNKMCWPHKDAEHVAQTYQSVLEDLGNKDINGWIGFSNGGYFLQELLRQKMLIASVITIGAAGHMDSTDQVYVMIGRHDTYAYNQAKALKYKIIEYEGGHAIDKEALKDVLYQFHN
jgi:hypothetical protein